MSSASPAAGHSRTGRLFPEDVIYFLNVCSNMMLRLPARLIIEGRLSEIRSRGAASRDRAQKETSRAWPTLRAGRSRDLASARLGPTSSTSSAVATRRGGASYNLEARPWPSEGKSLAGKQALEPRQQSVSNVELLALGSTIASGCSNILVGQAWLGAENPRLDYQQDITPLG
jgi:hypothetical protein